MQPQTRYAKSGDIYIAYQVFGEGPLNVVFAPLDLIAASPRNDATGHQPTSVTLFNHLVGSG